MERRVVLTLPSGETEVSELEARALRAEINLVLGDVRHGAEYEDRLRDEAALAALQGSLAQGLHSTGNPGDRAKDAWMLADAFMSERAKRKEAGNG